MPSSLSRILYPAPHLLLAGVALALYLSTLAPDLLPGDSGEFQFAAWRLGLAHPTGYPLYLLIGSAWQHLWAVAGWTPATALNALSAVMGAGAVGLLYEWMSYALSGSPGIRKAIAAFTALLWALNPTFWSQSIIAEVYSFHILLMLGIFLAAQRQRLFALCALLGFSLTHHVTTALLLPGLFLCLWWGGALRRYSWPAWMGAGAALLLPLLLYLYIPLRSGAQTSPWYHQPLGESALTLYAGDWPSFWRFVTGRSISVGFYSLAEALSHAREAAQWWQLAFGWPEFALSALGLLTLIRRGKQPLLALTLGYALAQQIFNLFYAIGDIQVYYIPFYLMGVVWAGFGLEELAVTHWGLKKGQIGQMAIAPGIRSRLAIGWAIALLAFLLPLRLWVIYAPRIDQADNREARRQWEAILAARPDENAILISNDRNEIAPLFYLQTVEGRAIEMTGLFPLIAAEARFTDIGATIETALSSGARRPVYLIKEMLGLEVKFALQEKTEPLVRVLGPSAVAAPRYLVGRPLGPLALTGYDWEESPDGAQISLRWQVEEALAGDYTTTVQLLDARRDKIAQDDRPPGGLYYPTSLWKPGEVLVDAHLLTLEGERCPAVLLVGMYQQPAMTPLAPSLEIPLPQFSSCNSDATQDNTP